MKASELWGEQARLLEYNGMDEGVVGESATTRQLADRDQSDTFHEPDGTHPMHIDANVGRQGPRVGDTAGAHRPSNKFNFGTGLNRGAEILIDEMRQLVERDGYADCYDDVSGERLEESGVREA